MKDEKKTKKQLIDELRGKRQKITDLKRADFQRKQAEEALKKSEEWYRTIVESSHAGILVVDENYRFTYVNDELTRILGYPRKEIIGKDFREFLDKEIRKLVQDRYLRRQKGEKVPSRYEFNIVRKDGKKRQVEISSTVLKTLRGENRTIAQILDITERKKANQKLKDSERRYRSVVENASDSIYIITPRGFQYVNPAFEKLTGYSSKELYSEGFNFWDIIHPEDAHMIKEREEARKIGEKIPSRYEFRIIAKNGKTKIVEPATVNIGKKGEAQVLGILRDVTEQRKAEENIKSSLREKEVMLKEIHHRVKNNMQIISSLLRLQSRNIKNPHILETFQRSQDRIRSMALVHEGLYRSKDLSRIDFSDYIKTQMQHLFSTYGVSPESIGFEIDAKDVYLDINKAIPCGLIISELVSNSIKHGFPGEEKGKIMVKMSCDKNGKIKLLVKDNGVGLNQQSDSQSTDTLGLKLVKDLVQQLQGSMEVKKDRGAEFRIVF